MIDVRICDPNEGGGPMTSESARDVLVGLMYRAWVASRGDGKERLGAALDALLAHPVELLALLAEPKVCEMCGGHGEAQWLASCSECGGLGLDPLRNDRACSRCGGSCEVLVIRDDVPCPSCHGSGRVPAVDRAALLAALGPMEPPEGWVHTAGFPKHRYWIREGATEWEMFTVDDHGAFS